MKKKYRCVFFSVAGTHEKNNNNIMKNGKKKKVGAEIGLGYCPDYIVRREIVSQYRYCIVTGNARLEAESVL